MNVNFLLPFYIRKKSGLILDVTIEGTMVCKLLATTRYRKFRLFQKLAEITYGVCPKLFA